MYPLHFILAFNCERNFCLYIYGTPGTSIHLFTYHNYHSHQKPHFIYTSFNPKLPQQFLHAVLEIPSPTFPAVIANTLFTRRTIQETPKPLENRIRYLPTNASISIEGVSKTGSCSTKKDSSQRRNTPAGTQIASRCLQKERGWFCRSFNARKISLFVAFW